MSNETTKEAVRAPAEAGAGPSHWQDGIPSRETLAAEVSGLSINMQHALVLIAALAIMSGLVGSWFFGSRAMASKQIVVIDVNKIFEPAKKSFADKYRDKTMSADMKLEMQREISSFTEKFNSIIEKQSRSKVILFKETVLSDNVKDITDEVKRQVSGSN